MSQAISKMETTALEWLMKEWPALKYQLPAWLIEQAKAMEKEQIMDAYGQGYVNAQNYEEIGREQFYDDTYGGKEL